MKNILFGLFPALMWGIQPIVMTKIAGKSKEKLVGMCLGIFLSSLLVYLFKRPENWSWSILLWSFIDGLALSYGLINQIRGFSLLGVSKGTPISTGSQLIGASLVGVVYFKEWTSPYQYILGSLAIVLVILGVSLTSLREKQIGQAPDDNLSKGIRTMLLSSLGFVIYTIIPRLTDISIWDALIPQGLGALLGAIILARSEKSGDLFTKKTFQHIVTGGFFALGNLSLMLSNVANGLAVGFTLTQMNVVVASLGGLIILKEEKTKKELRAMILGLALVVLGGILIGITKV